MKHKAKLTKISGFLLAVFLLASSLSAGGTAPAAEPTESSGFTQEKKALYSIQYDLGTAASHFTSTPSEAKAGETVEVKTGILFDADIHVYVNGQEISKSHYDSDYWGYSFIMPEKDVLITAKFYTKDAVWGMKSTEPIALREKYPEYFDLPTGKGLEVYVWQMAANSYSFGVMEGTNREKTLNELWKLRGASCEEMRSILSSYNINEDRIIIIPWQNPISSYIAEFWIRQTDEDPASAENRQQEYIDGIRAMLFGSDASSLSLNPDN